MGFWSNLFKPKAVEQTPQSEERHPFSDGQEITLDQYLQNYFNFNGNSYPSRSHGVYGNRESISNDYLGYSTGAYKDSPPIFACAQRRSQVFSEVRFGLQTFENNRPGDPQYHPVLKLLENPWPGGQAGDLLARAIQDVDLTGNFFAVRTQGINGPKIKRLQPDWVDIILSGDPEKDTDVEVVAYRYHPGGDRDGDNMEVFPANGTNGVVAHWAPIPDPGASFRGMSWMTPILREILADKAIGKHKLKFFENGATPNIAVSMKETVTPEKFAQFKRLMEDSYAGLDNAYKTMYVGGGADVTPIGAMIQQLDFKDLTNIGEERICAAAGTHPAIVGLGPGLEGSSLNAGNFEAAKELFVSGTLRPLWRTFCAAMEGMLDLPEGARLWYDDRDIAFLREDREKVSRRLQIDATSLTRLVMNGWEPDPSVEAIVDDDLRKLIGAHSGLYSVQLLPPNVSHPDQWGDANKDGVNDAQAEADKKAAKEAEKGGGKEGEGKPAPKAKAKGAPAHNTPSGSKRKPTGRPPKNEAKMQELLDAVRDRTAHEEHLIAELVRAGEDPGWLRAVLNGEPLPEEDEV